MNHRTHSATCLYTTQERPLEPRCLCGHARCFHRLIQGTFQQRCWKRGCTCRVFRGSVTQSGRLMEFWDAGSEAGRVWELPSGRHLVVQATLEDCTCKYGHISMDLQIIQNPCTICGVREAEDGHVCNYCKGKTNEAL